MLRDSRDCRCEEGNEKQTKEEKSQTKDEVDASPKKKKKKGYVSSGGRLDKYGFYASNGRVQSEMGRWGID